SRRRPHRRRRGERLASKLKPFITSAKVGSTGGLLSGPDDIGGLTCFLPSWCSSRGRGERSEPAERALQLRAQLRGEQLADAVDEERHLVADQADVAARGGEHGKARP